MENYVGIDIAKNKFDMHTRADGKWYLGFKYTEKNIRLVVKQLKALNPVLIVMEASGGYEAPLASALHAAGLPLAVVNPNRIRNFARAAGQLAKTDKIDSRIIAWYASAMKPSPQTAIDKITGLIKTLNARRRQLVAMRTSENNRKEHAHDKFVARSINVIVKTIDREISKVEGKIASLIDRTPQLKRKEDVIHSFPGVGDRTTSMLLGNLPEIGELNRHKIAALIGVAPMNRDSGQFRGKRMTGGGRVQVRTKLYMPTLVAIQHNPVIRDFYHRLVNSGKPKMTAVVACMRKMLVILNTMVKNDEFWIPINS